MGTRQVCRGSFHGNNRVGGNAVTDHDSALRARARGSHLVPGAMLDLPGVDRFGLHSLKDPFVKH